MLKHPKLTPISQIPHDIKAMCEQVNQVADGLPVLVFIPDADHTYLYPVVVIKESAKEHARLIETFLDGASFKPPSEALRRQNDLLLEAIHAATDYLPGIVFLPAGRHLHPVNLAPESVPEKLRPCYLALQRAQRTAIGRHPLDVQTLLSEQESG